MIGFKTSSQYTPPGPVSIMPDEHPSYPIIVRMVFVFIWNIPSNMIKTILGKGSTVLMLGFDPVSMGIEPIW